MPHRPRPTSRERTMRRGHTMTERMRESEGTATPTITPSGSFDEWGQSPPDSRRSSFGNDPTDVLASSSPRSRVDFLELPTAEHAGMMEGELAPRKQDSVDRIPMRARSQSWLIRTRHLLTDERAPTPIISNSLLLLSVLCMILTFPFCLFFCLKVAKEYERAVVFRLGRLIPGGTKGPGLFFVMPCIDTLKMVDLRVLSFDVPPQEILSKDSVTVSVDAVIFFRVSNPVISVTNVNDAQFSTKLLAQTTLRNVLGTKTLSEMLSERDNIASVTEKVLDEGTDPWGVKVERVEVKDIRLPHVLLRSMAAEAEAARDARARIIAAEGEKNASAALTQAADMICQSTGAIQLRYLQTLVHISSQRNHTIVLPYPADLVRRYLNRK
uniref:Band 7 domain-containing protein n=1 Tax=Plectus sambesii TaxID=2011161 RepID=A0A914XFU9_9BILA